MGTQESISQPLIRAKSLGEEIVEVVQRAIIAGEFRPGQRLVERELIGRFGVSSIPVRDALRELESRGLVQKRHNRGCSVIQLTPKDVARICELRRVLEPKVTEWAAEITPAGRGALRQQFDQLKRAADSGDLAAFFQEDLTFHRMIWDIAGNPYAARALETVLGSLFASGLIGAHGTDTIDLGDEIEKHRRMLDGVCDGDTQRAAMALIEIAAGFEKHLL
jgi:DNA-binding GntR family transcriptional regulator